MCVTFACENTEEATSACQGLSETEEGSWLSSSSVTWTLMAQHSTEITCRNSLVESCRSATATDVFAPYNCGLLSDATCVTETNNGILSSQAAPLGPLWGAEEAPTQVPSKCVLFPSARPCRPCLGLMPHPVGGKAFLGRGSEGRKAKPSCGLNVNVNRGYKKKMSTRAFFLRFLYLLGLLLLEDGFPKETLLLRLAKPASSSSCT